MADKGTYEKHLSFAGQYSRIGASVDVQRGRAVAAIEQRGAEVAGLPTNTSWVLTEAAIQLRNTGADAVFRITPFVADEMSLLPDESLPRYLYHRFRYEVFPQRHELDEWPPYLQIEPASCCNYRCVFCFQTDPEFSGPGSRHMGVMPFELFREVVDQAAGHVEFGSISSRGEPLLCRELPRMLEYCRGKFLNMKLNTNASLLNEELTHALLGGGVQTVVFSVDAADEETYRHFRVGGQLARVLANIRRFSAIRQAQYPQAKIITRVSGVRYRPADQNFGAMVSLWRDWVDQVAFVKYNSWENVYTAAPSGVGQPCSDLWRRLFVWHDGTVNPCDTDYCSTLAVGRIQGCGVAAAWRGERYERLRSAHLGGSRGCQDPCRRCMVI